MHGFCNELELFLDRLDRLAVRLESWILRIRNALICFSNCFLPCSVRRVSFSTVCFKASLVVEA